MIISCVVAVAENGIIGNKGKLPWHIPTDLKLFKKITTGGAILMGRKSFESIGKPLPNRTNIIITRQENYHSEDILTSSSIEEAISKAHALEFSEIFIIGGAEIFEQSKNYWDKIYFTLVPLNPEGDTWFPEVEWHLWYQVSQEKLPKGTNDEASITFSVFERL